jgi:hypothetical protein
MGKVRPALRTLAAPPELDRLTITTSALLLAVGQAQIELRSLSGLTPARSARAEILGQVLANIRRALMEII